MEGWRRAEAPSACACVTCIPCASRQVLAVRRERHLRLALVQRRLPGRRHVRGGGRLHLRGAEGGGEGCLSRGRGRWGVGQPATQQPATTAAQPLPLALATALTVKAMLTQNSCSCSKLLPLRVTWRRAAGQGGMRGSWVEERSAAAGPALQPPAQRPASERTT